MEALIKFLVGGVVVSAFAATGELFQPKTFSGIFGSAPSVALASLGLAFAKDGTATGATLARSMMLGAVALFVYSAACTALLRRTRWPVWLAATASWLVWLAVALGTWRATAVAGALR